MDKRLHANWGEWFGIVVVGDVDMGVRLIVVVAAVVVRFVELIGTRCAWAKGM